MKSDFKIHSLCPEGIGGGRNAVEVEDAEVDFITFSHDGSFLPLGIY